MIYHLAERTDWEERGNAYTAPSLETDGFIHCSTADQVDRVAAALFADRDVMVLLTIDEGAVESPVVYEDLYGSGEDFPHVYGPIPVAAVSRHHPYTPPQT